MRETTNRQTRPIHNLISYYSRRALTAVVLTACALMLSATNAAADQSGSQDTRIVAALSGAAIGGVTPKGEAEFRQRADGRRSLEVEVEHVNLPAGTVLNVLIDGVQVGQLTLAPTLENEFEIESEHGATVPSVAVGSTVVVTNAQGQTVLSGVFNSASSVLTPKANDIDDTNYFVSQQYRDFLDREADDDGLDFRKGEIERCCGHDACRQRMHVNTSVGLLP